jgi:ABC-type Mn2+/Zn2+ transport system permease subunit
MLALSAAIGAFCAVAGLYASYYLQAASGATIVLLATARRSSWRLPVTAL